MYFKFMTSGLYALTSPPDAFGFVFLLSPLLYSSVLFFSLISLGLRPTLKCSGTSLSLLSGFYYACFKSIELLIIPFSSAWK